MRLAITLVATLFLLATGAAQAQSGTGEPGTIVVQGTGTVNAAPDLADVQVGVVSAAQSAGEAMQANNALAAKVFDYLKGRGIAEEDMQTIEISINPQYPDRRTTDGAPEIVGYTVQNRLSVTIRKLDTLGEVLDGLVRAGANTVSGIRFDVAGREKLQDEALASAVAAARARAQLIARAADVTLGRLVEISASGEAPPRPMFARAEASSVPIAPGSLTISTQVNAVFAID